MVRKTATLISSAGNPTFEKLELECGPRWDDEFSLIVDGREINRVKELHIRMVAGDRCNLEVVYYQDGEKEERCST